MGPAIRFVDPVFQQSRRLYVGVVPDLVKAGSIGFDEDVEHVGLFLVARKAGAQRFIIHARASNWHFLSHPSGPLLTGEDFAVSNFRERLRIVGSADIMRIPGWLQAFFALPAVLASNVG